MTSLHELQQQFAEAMFSREELPPLASHILGDDAARRIRVYRGTVFGNYTSALAAIYPVVQKLVGDAFFRQMAREYIRCYPSDSGDLFYYGRDFPVFLEQFPPVAQLPYLADTARLELAYHHVFHAAESEPLSFQALAEIPQTSWPDIRFHLNPACRLLQSPWPVQRIWQANQPDADPAQPVSLDDGSVSLLVLRRVQHIEIQPLTAGEYALLSACQQHQTFETACTAALAAEPALMLNDYLQKHVLQTTLTHFDLQES